jgi:hypothetical protein
MSKPLIRKRTVKSLLALGRRAEGARRVLRREPDQPEVRRVLALIAELDDEITGVLGRYDDARFPAQQGVAR